MASPLIGSRNTFGAFEKSLTSENQPKVYRFRANDGDFDRYQDRLSVQGWKLSDFNANPVIFYNHDSGLGLCSDRKTLPIGKGRAFVEGDALLVDIEFDEDDPFAKAVQQKVEKGILNAVSVGYRMAEGKYKENERGGYDSEEQELLEISVVTIPGNQRALRIRAAHEARDAFARELLDTAKKEIVADILKALDERDAKKAAVEPAPELKFDAKTFADLISEAALKELQGKWN